MQVISEARSSLKQMVRPGFSSSQPKVTVIEEASIQGGRQVGPGSYELTSSNSYPKLKGYTISNGLKNKSSESALLEYSPGPGTYNDSPNAKLYKPALVHCFSKDNTRRSESVFQSAYN